MIGRFASCCACAASDHAATAPMPEGLDELMLAAVLSKRRVELVKCRTVDLEVPAQAQIILEGYVELGELRREGPFGDHTGFYSLADDYPVFHVTCITHRNDPILRGTIEGSMPGSYSENGICSSIMRAATAWNVLDRAGVPGITDVWCPPVQAGINLLVSLKQSYRNQAKQAANAIWGSSAAHVRYKHITVVDDDIDIHDYGAVDWAIAYRVNAGEDDIIIMPSTFGLGLDPSTRKRDRNTSLYASYTAASFARQEAKEVAAINTMGADVMSLEEVENALVTYARLREQIDLGTLEHDLRGPQPRDLGGVLVVHHLGEHLYRAPHQRLEVHPGGFEVRGSQRRQA